MLGRRILDPDLVEAATTEAEGLGWLPFETRFHREKIVCHVRGRHVESRLPVAGYEIHMGSTQSPAAMRPVVQITRRSGAPTDDQDGMQSEDGGVWGTYLHGLFHEAAFRRWWLNRLRARRQLPPLSISRETSPEAAFDHLASVVRSHLNVNAIYELMGLHAR
jgi:adenosylcobyric acid synthase